MLRRSFFKLAGLASLGVLIPTWAVHAWDWLTYRPLTDDEITNMVAWAVAHTNYRREPALYGTGPTPYALIPLLVFKPMGHTSWLESPEPPRITKRFIYGENWVAYQTVEDFHVA